MKTIKFIISIENSGIPLIQVEEGLFKEAIFIVDTGSNYNVLFISALKTIKGQFKVSDKSTTLGGISGTTNGICGTAPLSFFGNEKETTFLVSEKPEAIKDMQTALGIPIQGIIGSYFMYDRCWIIDMFKQEISTCYGCSK